MSKHPLLPPQCGARHRAAAATTTQTDHSRSRTYTSQRGRPRVGSTNPKQQQTLKYMYTNIPLTETGGRAVAALGGDLQVPSLYRKTSRHNQAGRANQLEPARAEASSNPRCTGSSGVHWSIWSAPIRLHQNDRSRRLSYGAGFSFQNVCARALFRLYRCWPCRRVDQKR